MNDDKVTTIELSIEEERRLRFSRERAEARAVISAGEAEIARKRREQERREKAEADQAVIDSEGRYWQQAVRQSESALKDAQSALDRAQAERDRRVEQLNLRIAKGFVPVLPGPTPAEVQAEAQVKQRVELEKEHQLALAKHSEPNDIRRMQREHTAAAKAEAELLQRETTFLCHCGTRLKNGTKYHKRDESHFCVPSNDPAMYLQAGLVPNIQAARELHRLDGDIQFLRDLNEGLGLTITPKSKDYSGVNGPNAALLPAT